MRVYSKTASFDEFLAKRIMTLALIENMDFLLRTAAVVNSGETGSGIRHDTEPMQPSPVAATLARVGAIVVQHSIDEKIDSPLGDFETNIPTINIVDDLLLSLDSN